MLNKIKTVDIADNSDTTTEEEGKKNRAQKSDKK